MTLLRLPLVALLLLGLLPHGASAAPPPRPFAGIGILIIDPARAVRPADNPAIVLYREPGVERVATLPLRNLPGLAPAIRPAAGEAVAAVVDKRGEWVRIAYDDAGRTGWVAMERTWLFRRWQEYLSGASVKLFGGLRKGFAAIREEPRDESTAIAAANGAPLRVMAVNDDWCMVLPPSGPPGWLRWRDGDRRFLVTVDGTVSPQNH